MTSDIGNQDLAPAGGSSVASKYKIVFMGDAFVGKTCLINRFMYDTFDLSYQVIDFIWNLGYRGY